MSASEGMSPPHAPSPLAVAWDIDGTLIDSEPVHLLALQSVCRDHRVAIDDLPAIAARYDGTGPIATNPRPIRGATDLEEILALAF